MLPTLQTIVTSKGNGHLEKKNKTLSIVLYNTGRQTRQSGGTSCDWMKWLSANLKRGRSDFLKISVFLKIFIYS